jgi:hypothetical protein
LAQFPQSCFAPFVVNTTLASQIERVLAGKAAALVARDAQSLEELLAPAFVYVNASGQRHDKASYIAAYCVSGHVTFRSQAVSDLEVHAAGGFAVATFQANDVFVAGDRTVTAAFRSFCVFSRDGGRWRWAGGQTMAIPMG